MSLKQYHTNTEDKQTLGIRDYTPQELKLMRKFIRENKVLIADGDKIKRRWKRKL
jgi:hypothetical protein